LSIIHSIHTDKETIKSLYKSTYHSCLEMIIANYGTAEDARILFQEAVLIFIKDGQNPDFKLPVAPKIYLYALCRNLWLEKLEAQKNPRLEWHYQRPR
jgi:hypothetical protein